MKKSILSFGLELTKAEQKLINGGREQEPDCVAAYIGCDTQYPNNYTHFDNCMRSLGC